VPDSLREILRGQLDAVEWLASLKGTRVDGMLSLRDPIPGLVDIWRYGSRALRHRLRRASEMPSG
jgi:hypothetical protein